jgi:Domain of unknown function (DUF6046)
MAEVVYTIPELAMIAQDVKYNPALAIALNRLMRTRIKEDYDIALKEATVLAMGYENVRVLDRKDYGKSSQLTGAPLFQPLLLKGFDGQDDYLLESAVVELDRQKNIVSTVVQGRDTSVDEFINNGDWMITVSGIICFPGPRYPLDQVVEFERFMDANHALSINHELMNSLGIHEIVILGHQLRRTPHINCQGYTFNAKSTQPLPLIVSDLPEDSIV